MNILDDIIAHKREEVAARKAARPLGNIILALSMGGIVRDFRSVLMGGQRPAPRIIAEIKRRSPSKGELRPDLDPAKLAYIYEQNGASAISVLTDGFGFGGSLGDLAAARRAVSIPMLCKEFIVDLYQIYEARMYGADAVLLLASVLGVEELRKYRRVAVSLRMAALVEVHNQTELAHALEAEADLIGVNNRDLRTFAVDLDTTRKLLPLIPPGVVTVSESGIRNAQDRAGMEELGVHALLVGESLLLSPDVALATREICGIVSAVEEVTAR